MRYYQMNEVSSSGQNLWGGGGRAEGRWMTYITERGKIRVLVAPNFLSLQ